MQVKCTLVQSNVVKCTLVQKMQSNAGQMYISAEDADEMYINVHKCSRMQLGCRVTGLVEPGYEARTLHRTLNASRRVSIRA